MRGPLAAFAVALAIFVGGCGGDSVDKIAGDIAALKDEMDALKSSPEPSPQALQLADKLSKIRERIRKVPLEKQVDLVSKLKAIK